MKNKKTVIVITSLVIAGIFVIGADWAGDPVHHFFHNYFADFAIPFGFYFLLHTLEDNYSPLKNWYMKACAVFVLCALSETLQYVGIYALASVFDPLDYLMYAVGAISAAFVDIVIFRRVFSFWQ